MSKTGGKEGGCVREEIPHVEFLVGPEEEDSREEEALCQRSIYGIPSGIRRSSSQRASNHLKKHIL